MLDEAFSTDSRLAICSALGGERAQNSDWIYSVAWLHGAVEAPFLQDLRQAEHQPPQPALGTKKVFHQLALPTTTPSTLALPLTGPTIHIPLVPCPLLTLGPFLALCLPALVGDDALVLLLQVPAHTHGQPVPQLAPVYGVQHVEDVPTGKAEP